MDELVDVAAGVDDAVDTELALVVVPDPPPQLASASVAAIAAKLDAKRIWRRIALPLAGLGAGQDPNLVMLEPPSVDYPKGRCRDRGIALVPI